MHNRTDNHDYGTEDDGPPASNPIRYKWYEGNRGDGAETVARDEKTEDAASGVIEMFLPVIKRLETIHHGAVETGSTFDKHSEGHQPQVQTAEVPFAVPWCFVILDEFQNQRVDLAAACHSEMAMR